MTERDQLYSEIDTEVYTILASFQLHHPMYSEGIRAGIQKCQAILEEAR